MLADITVISCSQTKVKQGQGEGWVKWLQVAAQFQQVSWPQPDGIYLEMSGRASLCPHTSEEAKCRSHAPSLWPGTSALPIHELGHSCTPDWAKLLPGKLKLSIWVQRSKYLEGNKSVNLILGYWICSQPQADLPLSAPVMLSAFHLFARGRLPQSNLLTVLCPWHAWHTHLCLRLKCLE